MSTTNQTTPMPRPYTVDEVARYLRVSCQTVRNWIAAGQITPLGLKTGMAVRLTKTIISHKELCRFMDVPETQVFDMVRDAPRTRSASKRKATT